VKSLVLSTLFALELTAKVLLLLLVANATEVETREYRYEGLNVTTVPSNITLDARNIYIRGASITRIEDYSFVNFTAVLTAYIWITTGSASLLTKPLQEPEWDGSHWPGTI
jgi:hypothetical protein